MAIRKSLACLAVLVAACGGADIETSGTNDPVTQDPVTTVVATTVADQATVSTTTTTVGTTTSEAAPTTIEATPSEGLDAIVARIDQAEPLQSARVEGSISILGMEGAQGLGEFTIPFSTSFDNASGNSSFLIDMGAMAGAVEADPDDPFAGMAAAMFTTMELRQVGDQAYVKMGFLTALLGSETEWIAMSADEAGDFSSSMEMAESDPTEMLNQYREADAVVEELGTETVNGVDTTHFRVVVDAEAWAQTLDPAERAELEENGPLPGGELPMDLWISEDGHLVRMVMEIDGSTVEAPPGEAFERMVMTYDVFDINQPVVIEPPAEYTDIEDLEGGFSLGDG
ncbi:MAG: hypothetical protein OEW30_05055 [Acidimicrobiia bacterium]|nr:hypothetical protein [Acidimicrobiia bacterium]